MRVFTVGHGNRSLDELVAMLREAGVVRLVDARRYPASRRHPHFARESLAKALPAAGIAYDFRGDELGGRRQATAQSSRHPAWRDPSFRAYADYMDSPAFRAALARLEADATREPLAFMCAERLWWQCHRRLIADALALRGAEVVHLLAPAEQRPHVLHPDVRPGDDGWPVYDLHVQRSLVET
jgi:uncharacterized protein (DUF488 family)